jgi:transposase
VQTEQHSRRNLRRGGFHAEASSALKVVEEGLQGLIEDLAGRLDRIDVAEARPMDRSQPVLPMMSGMPERRTHDYPRDGITSLFAAFNIADGSIISQLHRRHRAIEFRKFLAAIDKAVPAGLDVHLVCDNYATHNTAEIRAWLARHPRFRVHFTPAGSSWMNQAERSFGLLTGKLIRRGVHTSVQALEHDIRDGIATWNDNPGSSGGPRPPTRS